MWPWNGPTRGAANTRRAWRSTRRLDAFSSAAEIPQAISAGCIFSNELLDALPVHRVMIEQGRLREICVGLEGAQFVEIPSDPSSPVIEEYFQRTGNCARGRAAGGSVPGSVRLDGERGARAGARFCADHRLRPRSASLVRRTPQPRYAAGVPRSRGYRKIFWMRRENRI